MNAVKELGRLVGASRVSAAPAALTRASRDFGGHDLGRALAVVRPASTEHVRALVLWARRARVPLTPMGGLTSFWASTRVAGRVALDMRGMARLLSVDPVEGVARAEAGLTVAALDAALSRRGLTLSGAPDGFGDATLGSLVANDTVAGLGQFHEPASSQVLGVTAVLGTGEVLRAGAAAALPGLAPFARQGLPDPTGLLLASEGALGVVTELWLRARPAPVRASLAAPMALDGAAFERLAAAARALRGAAAVERLMLESWVSLRSEEARVDLAAPDRAGLDAGAARVAAAFRAAKLPVPAEGVPSALTPGLARSKRSARAGRWQERPLGKENWRGVSLQVPYAAVGRVWSLWQSSLRGRVAAAADPEGFLRVYLNAHGCAALFGWSFPASEAAEARSGELERLLRAQLGPLGLPYRGGTVWRGALDGRLDPGYAAVLSGVKALWDPDGVLNPGVGAVEAAARRAPGRPAR